MVFYFISELIFVLNKHKDTSLSDIESVLIKRYVKLSKHIYFCDKVHVYFRTFYNHNKYCTDLANVICFKSH